MVDLVIVGAGPYGLSAAAHLRRIAGLEVRLFGEPMRFWERHMPAGMLLRSKWEASHLSDPEGRLTLDAYRELEGNGHLKDPVAAKDFIEYGRWFHRAAGLSAEVHEVQRIDLERGRYRVLLDSGETLHSKRVVVAAGIQRFAYRPELYDELPAELASHSSETRDFGRFKGKEVLVIGGGQSAAECASFLLEAGARAEMLVRKPLCHGKARFAWLPRGQWTRIFYGRGDVGPAGISLIVQHPNLFRCLPKQTQRKWDRRSHKTGFSLRCVPIREIPIQRGKSICAVRAAGEKVRCELNDGTVRMADHIILATGYRVNVARYEFLSPEILRNLDLVEGYPRLDAGLESSLPGLHFLGAPAAWSFGPLVRFVAGSEYLARALAKRIRRAGAVGAADCARVLVGQPQE